MVQLLPHIVKLINRQARDNTCDHYGSIIVLICDKNWAAKISFMLPSNVKLF